MKNEKDFRKEILESLSDDVPEIKGNVKATYIERSEERARKKKKGPLGLILGTAIPVLSCGIVLAIALPTIISSLNRSEEVVPASSATDIATSGGGTPISSYVDSNTVIEPVVDVPAEAVESIAYRVASGGNFLATESSQVSSVSALIAPKARANNPAPTSTIASALEDVNPFMKTAEEMIDGNQTLYSDITYDGTYYTVTLEDGTAFTYTETSHGYHGDEYLYYIKGTYVVEGVTYEVEGKREVSSTTGESETETTFRFYLNGVKTLTIEGEIEEETEGATTETENSIKYVYYGDGTSTSTLEVELSYEVEGIEEEMSIEVTKGNQEAEYLVNRVDASNLTLNYEFESGQNEYAGTIDVAVGTDTYTYSVDGTTVATLPRI